MLFIDRVFRQHRLLLAIISDRDPRFTGKFWTSIFKVLDTQLDMSTADHSQTEGQTERVNRVIGDVLRSVCAESPKIFFYLDLDTPCHEVCLEQRCSCLDWL